MKFDPRRWLDPDDNAIGASLGLLFFVTALIVFGGHLYSGDGEAYFIVAFKLITGQTPSVPAFLEGFAVEGVGGQLYAKFGIGQSLLTAPFVAVALVLGSIFPVEVLGGGQLRAAALLLGPVVGSIGIVSLYLCQRELAISKKAATVSTLFCGLGGLLVVYSRFLLPELSLATVFVVLTWGFIREDRRGDWMIGIASAFAILLRYDALMFVAPIVIVRWYTRKSVLPLLLPVGISLFVMGGYNWLRFGELMAVGMGDSSVETFSTPLLLGLYGQFFAVGNGLFLYAPYLGPALLLALWDRGHRLIARRGTTLLIACGLFICLHAKWYSWMGGWSWGPRRMIPLLMIAHIPIGLLWDRLYPATKGLLGTLGLVSFLVNLPGMITNFNHYYEGSFYRVDVLFTPEYAQLRQQALGLFEGRYPIDVFWVWGIGRPGWIVMGIFLVINLLLIRRISLLQYHSDNQSTFHSS